VIAGRPRVVLCDLDDTLFDHAGATRAALAAVRDGSSWFGGWTLDALDLWHRELLDQFHVHVLGGRMTVEDARVARFRCLLEEAAVAGAGDAATDVAAEYRRAYEASWRPVAGALELLRAIRSAGGETVIVTNSTVDEQRQKIAYCGFTGWIASLVTSEEAGTAKPDPRIFHDALARVGASPGDAVMFGDAWATDIEGARATGVRAVWFNRGGATSPDPSIREVRSLAETSRVLEVLFDLTVKT
jgi:putative hydrolase of the HAD superfamily